jgi:hypothetical protein
MAKIEEIKELVAPTLAKAGVSEETLSAIFGEAGISDDVRQEVSQKTAALTTLQAAEADVNLRNSVIRQTMEAIEAKVLEKAKGLKNKKLPESKLEEIWKQKHASEKVISLLDMLDSADVPADMVSKSEFEATLHKLKEAEGKAKAGSQAWQDIISQKDNALTELQKQHQKTIAEHQARVQEMENQRINDDLLSFVRGKIAGEGWFIKSTEQEIVNRARQTAAFIRENGQLQARNPDNAEVPIFGENKSVPLTPEQLVLKIANEMKVLDKQGAGASGANQPRVPAGGQNGSAQQGKTYRRGPGTSGGQKLDATTQKRVSANDDQFAKMGLT